VSASPPETTRITILTEIPAPFRVPLFNALAATTNVELDVIFLAQADPRRNYSVDEADLAFRRRTLPGRSILRKPRWLIVNGRVASTLDELRPDVLVIGGWNQPTFWRAFTWARRHAIPVVVWVESTALDTRPSIGILERARRTAIERAAAFIVPGIASADYVRTLGARDEAIAIAPNAVDMRVFREAVEAARADRELLRSTLSLGRATLLYVGRLDPEKGLDVLLHAVRNLDADLVVAGVGRDAERLRRSASANVRFVGWLEPQELVPWYAAADVFVLPSLSEPWGMVLNEAAAAALPIVTTTAVGAAMDLVEEGVNGYAVAPGDAEALERALRVLCEDEPLRASAGRRSAALADTRRPEDWASAVAELSRALAPPRGRAQGTVSSR